MNIVIKPSLGSVRIDFTSDIDHLARYRFFLAEQIDGKWREIPNAVTPPDSNTQDPRDHLITLGPAQLDGRLLQVSARVNSIVKEPENLDLNLRVYQDQPFKAGTTKVADTTTYPIDYHTPVPPGEEKRIVASFLFELS